MTEADLLAAVIADPGCDVLRIAYADWLDEQQGTGEATPRAEFIRVQLRLAQCRDGVESCPPDSRCGRCMGCELRQRERELLDTHKCHWLGELVAAVVGSDADIAGLDVAGLLARYPVILSIAGSEFHRGFISSITLFAADLRQHMDSLLTSAPITEVTLKDWPIVATEHDHDSDSVVYRLPKRKTFTSRRRLLPFLVAKRGLGDPTLREVTEALLNACWPSVKTWRLPA